MGFPASYLWYGGKGRGPGGPPKWVQGFLAEGASQDETKTQPIQVEEHYLHISVDKDHTIPEQQD